MADLDSQNEEIEALSAIYGDEFKVINELAREYSVVVKAENSPNTTIEIRITLPSNYPSQTHPRFEFKSKAASNDDIDLLNNNFERIWNENKGEGVLYQWVEFVREYMQVMYVNDDASETDSHKPHETEKVEIINNCPHIDHGQPFTDKKSTFQAHVAAVQTTEEAKIVVKSLLQNRKIANATHNIMAYRIKDEKKNLFAQDCDDDGETAAGGRLLHLLEIVGAVNVIVVVTRWYGGILLGPDRFKHINNVARECLVEAGFIKQDSNKKKSKK